LALADTAFAQAAGDRIAVFVVLNEAPKSGAVQPRLVMVGTLTFNPEARTVRGGGNFEVFDQASAQKTILAQGRWQATQFGNWDTKSLPTYRQIQPGILDLRVNMDQLGAADLRVICNVGFVPLSTGEPEGIRLTTTQHGRFDPVTGLTHTSVPGYTTEVVRRVHHHHHHHHIHKRKKKRSGERLD
jgi:hypothetical protein